MVDHWVWRKSSKSCKLYYFYFRLGAAAQLAYLSNLSFVKKRAKNSQTGMFALLLFIFFLRFSFSIFSFLNPYWMSTAHCVIYWGLRWLCRVHKRRVNCFVYLFLCRWHGSEQRRGFQPLGHHTQANGRTSEEKWRGAGVFFQSVFFCLEFLNPNVGMCSTVPSVYRYYRIIFVYLVLLSFIINDP